MNEGDASPESWAVCSCNICSGKLEFDPANTGETIQCPHCGMDTVLFIPQADTSAEPVVHESSPIPDPPETVPPKTPIVTTGNEISGCTIENYLGIARGIVVRSPDLIQGMFGGLKQIVGGNIETYARVCDETRRQAFGRMVEHAQNMKADAIIAMRFDSTEFAPGITEVLAYGTAVKLRFPEARPAHG